MNADERRFSQMIAVFSGAKASRTITKPIAVSAFISVDLSSSAFGFGAREPFTMNGTD
jgi:hypothetical protein